MATAIEVRKTGRRFYIQGAPYAARDTLRDAGCRWDPEEKGWWTGKGDVAEKLVAHLTRNAPDPDAPETVSSSAAVLKGRATYKGKSYYLLASGTSAKTGRPYAKVCSRDGQLVFWVKDFDEFRVESRYQTPKSIEGLRRFAAEAKAQEDQYGCGCSCHGGSHCDCGRGWCGFHHDGCDRCGCEF
ncbi:hypothetical protein A5637_16350 [Mycolicibacterium fortuitum]|nr:hypothetical protein A5637_16350 [Mycolicibacterium fortuitum]